MNLGGTLSTNDEPETVSFSVPWGSILGGRDKYCDPRGSWLEDILGEG